MKISQLFASYLAATARDQSSRTLADRRHVLDFFARDFGNRRVEKLVPGEVVVWTAGHPRWRSGWTIKRVYATLLRPFSWAKKLRLIKINPIDGLTHPEGPGGQPLGEDSFRQWLRMSRAEFRRVLVFLRFVGARPVDMAELAWPDIDWGQGIATLWRHKTSKKTRKPKVLVFHPVVQRLLRWLRDRSPSGSIHVFLNARGKPWTRNALGLRVMRLRQRTGTPASCKLYGLRHAFGTRAVRQGNDLKTVSLLMGHSDTRTTERYLHLGDLAHLHQALGKTFGNGQK